MKVKSKFLSLIFIFVILLSVINTNVYAKELPSGVQYENLKNRMDSYIEENKATTVGLGTIVYDEDGILYKKLYGYSDKENEILVDDNTVFEWGSTSKLLVWVSVMQLEEQGLIDLNADINDYLPDNFLKLTYDKKITMLDLMNHQAGFQEVYIGTAEIDINKILTLEEALKKYQPIQVFEPGTRTAYSNYGATLAAYIVQRISGCDYTEYVHKNIFDVLDMRNTSIGAKIDDTENVYNQRLQLKCYDLNGKLIPGDNISYINFSPAGSGIGTLDDFYKFASAITPNSNRECPLFKNKDTLNKLLSPTSYYGNSGVINCCHGFFASQYGVDTLGHGGNTFGSSAMIQFDPVSKIGMVVFTNQAHEKVYNYDMYEILFGNFKDSKYSKIEREVPQGMAINTRGIFKGPLKITSAIGLNGFDESDLDSWWYQEGDIVYGGFADLYMDTTKVITNIIIFVLFAIGGIYSIITTISCIIHMIAKKIQNTNKANYILNGINSAILLNTILVILKILNGTITGDMGSYISYKISFVITAILFVLLCVYTIISILKLKKEWNELTKKQKAKYITTIAFIVVTLITGITFDMYEFWNF